MRRLCLTLLCGLVAVPAALAATHATGDGVLEVSNGSGTIVLNTSRGLIWGQMAKGRLVVTDPVPGDGAVYVSGAEGVPVSENVTAYKGRDLHFRVTGGKVKLQLKGFGIDLTAVGVGTAQLNGDAFVDDAGEYALNNGSNWNPLPVYATKTVSFGVQPAPAP
ncbi:MAG TPA: hypothetical protein VH210_03265 [Gaiellaceae bacterium]|jgi:hypothetical protein|nr:hypothetical protein [Gaiellaceae bacterium]